MRFCRRIKRSCYMVFILARGFGMIINLYLVAIKHRHPFFAGFYRDTDKEARIAIFLLHFIYDADNAIAEFFLSPVAKAHAAMTSRKAVLNVPGAGANLFPAVKVLAIEKLPPTGIGSRDVFVVVEGVFCNPGKRLRCGGCIG